MTDLDGLLHGVLANPADDAARLIYADAMEESGHPINTARAEFIRLQLADEGRPRQRELLDRWLADWFGQQVQPLADEWWAVGELGDPKAFRFAINRGFIHEVANHGLPEGEWDRWVPWNFADSFSRAVADLFTDHPLERIVLEVADGEELRIETAGNADGEELWTCRRTRARRALCTCRSRDGLWEKGLAEAVRDQLFLLARNAFNNRQAR